MRRQILPDFLIDAHAGHPLPCARGDNGPNMDPPPPDAPDLPSPTDADGMGQADLKMSPKVRQLRRFWRTIPSAPRCKVCTSPFGAPGGPLMRLIGKGRWAGNSDYCGGCFKQLYRHRDGAEIECTLLFADIRGSTQLAESMRATEFRTLLDRFYRTAAEVLIEHEAIVDKFVGDEVIGIFIPALAGENHAGQAIDAGLALLRATGHETDTPWARIGIGINTGVAFVGVVGTSRDTRSRPDPSLVRPPRLALRPPRGQYWRFAGPCAT